MHDSKSGFRKNADKSLKSNVVYLDANKDPLDVKPSVVCLVIGVVAAMIFVMAVL